MTDLEKRSTLLTSIAAAKKMRWLNEQVLVDNTEHVVATDLNTASKILLGQTANEKTLATFESIVEYISKLPQYEQLVAEARLQGVPLPSNTVIPEFKPGEPSWFRMLINQCSQ